MGQRDQHRDAALRGAADPGCHERAGQGPARLAFLGPGRGLQAQRFGHPRIARPGCDRAAAREGGRGGLLRCTCPFDRGGRVGIELGARPAAGDRQDSMPRYLVTGAAGFIGARVAEQLLQEGHTVLGLDNLNDAYDRRLKDWRLARLQSHTGFACPPLDICAREARASAWEPGLAAVINLAARAGVRASVRDPWAYARTNLEGTLNLLELCRERGPLQLVQASTSSLYGAHNPRPFREDADTRRPLSPYRAPKGAAELLCHTHAHLYGLDLSALGYC